MSSCLNLVLMAHHNCNLSKHFEKLDEIITSSSFFQLTIRGIILSF